MEGNVRLTSTSAALKKGIDVKEESWFKDALSDPENAVFSEPVVENLFMDPSAHYEWSIPVSRYVNISTGKEKIEGVIIVNFKYDIVTKICEDLSESIDEYVYLMNSSGEIISHPYQLRYEEGVKPENNSELAGLSDGSYKKFFLDSLKIYAIKTVGYTGWRFVSVNLSYNFTKGAVKRAIVYLLILSIFMVLILNLGEFISNRVSRPIGDLERSVRKLALGKLDTKIEVYGSAEVRSLARSVNSMEKRINVLMDAVKREQKLKLKSEMDSLQAQINPHFLYNTLDIITWMIEKDRKAEATEVVSALAKLFRISISKGKNVITVGDELEHVKNYLIIQSMRYRDSFSHEIILEAGCEGLATVKLIVQPLVENAIYHAMEFMEDEGELVVRAYRQGDDLFISVKDNGMGMTEEEKSSLLKAPVTSKRGNGIGVYNVNERIKLYFGIEYGLIINSEPDEGTEVIIHMPAINYEDWKE